MEGQERRSSCLIGVINRGGAAAVSTRGSQRQRPFLAGTREGSASVLLLVTREVRASNYSDLRSSAVSSMISCGAMTKVLLL
jgi:hypothetical protein